MTKPIALAAGLAVLCLSTGAFAQSTVEKQACESDAFKLCGQAIPDRHRVFACLKKNFGNLSPSCHDIMAKYTHAKRASTVGAGNSD